jgi:hypothetical protein
MIGPLIIQLTPDPMNSVPNDCFTVSGGNVLYLDQPVGGTATNISQRVYTGTYRMVGALNTYTNSLSATAVVPFSQDGDTFYLTVPDADINSALGNSDTAFALAGVPNGLPVEWLGRCVSSGKVIVYSPLQGPGQPVAYPTVPGYDVTSLVQTAEKYRVWTDFSQRVHARANAGGTTLECMTDGWVLHRSQ